jgi:hypothetical protein
MKGKKTNQRSYIKSNFDDNEKIIKKIANSD